jgi:hypothetical protein
VTAERFWRRALYYLFIGLVLVAAVAAVAAVVAVAVGALPVSLGEDELSGPVGVLVGLAGAIIGFLAVAAALAIMVLVLYGLGFFLFGVFLFAAFVVLLSLGLAFSPLILVGLVIWWIVRRNRAAAVVPAAPRVEPTMADPGR